MMVTLSPSIRRVRPRHVGGAAVVLCQNPWLRSTTWLRPGWYSSAANARPSSGATPNVAKKSSDTVVPAIRSAGWPGSETPNAVRQTAVSPAKLGCWSRISRNSRNE